MSTVKLAGGASIELEMTPNFPVVTGLAELDLSSDRVSDKVTLGFLDISSGITMQPPDSLASTVFAMFVGTLVKHTHTQPLTFGYRQVGNISFNSYLYAGRKPEDGSIIDATTGLNRQWILDPSHSGPPSFLSRATPFTHGTVPIPPNTEMIIRTVDQPSGGNRLRRKNRNTDKINYLFSHKSNTRYFTALYVIDDTIKGTSTPLALEGFMWEHVVDVDVNWKKGVPSVVAQRNSARFIERFTFNIRDFEGFQVMNVATASPADNLTKKINDAMDRARTSVSDGLYEFSHHPNYETVVDSELNDNRARGGFDFDI